MSMSMTSRVAASGIDNASIAPFQGDYAEAERSRLSTDETFYLPFIDLK